LKHVETQTKQWDKPPINWCRISFIHCNFSQTNPGNPSGAVPRVAIVQNSSTQVPKMTVFRHGAMVLNILVVSQLHISDPGTREKRVIGGSREGLL